ncbi:MAG TPA: hypothetical protein VNI20_02335 [Fimbriimonadaceae bacterium]|nr:hypothetical protein [Fimbriimonadaceae bacterium]
MALRAWAREQWRVYNGNASSVRDYRAQLRGYKPAVMWALYLGLLILFAMMGYSATVGGGVHSATRVQNDLNNFFHLLFTILEAMVALVAPVIVAMSIQGEVQRKSLDLVMTAPVSPKYFLVGKVLSGYRYIIMLLFLSLPVTAASFVLGGATWSEVLIAYLLLAMHGLLYIGLTLPIAVLCNKVISTVLYSYVVCWGIGFLPLLIVIPMSSVGSMGVTEMPFFLLLFPGTQTVAASTFTTIFGAHFPNWILATLMILFIVKFMMLAAGSAMTRKGSKETRSLRIHGLVLALVFSVLVGVSAGGLSGFLRGSSPVVIARMMATTVTVLSLPIVFALPYISCWSYIDEQKQRPLGLVSVRNMLTAAPEGGLLYLWALLACLALGMYVPSYLNGVDPGMSYLVYMFWLFGAWTFLWAAGWFSSSFSKTGVSTARKSHVAFTIIVTLFPWPVLGMINAVVGPYTDLMQVYPLMALSGGLPLLNVFVMGIEFWVFAAIAVIWAEKRRKSSYSFKEWGVNEQTT